MSDEEKNERLSEITTEEYVWIVYLIIIGFSYLANYYEREYLINNSDIAKERYREIIIFIFFILTIIYSYFLNNAYHTYKNISIHDDINKKKYAYLSYLASLLILISGVIFLYIAIKDEDISIELAFN